MIKTTRVAVVTAAAGIACVAASGMSPAWAQDASKGEQVFNMCSPCHAVGPDAPNKIGPQLNGLDGRRSGTAADFSYSQANKNSGIVWDEKSFAAYITDPKSVVPGTKMVFPGIKDPQRIADLWAYLKQFDASGNKK